MTAPQLALPLAPRRAPHSVAEYGPPFVHAPLARSGDPETSHEAAAGYLAAAEVQAAQIHAALLAMGPRGGTYVEIADALGWEPVVVARRLAALREAALIVRLEARRACEGHRPMHVHVATRRAA